MQVAPGREEWSEGNEVRERAHTKNEGLNCCKSNGRERNECM